MDGYVYCMSTAAMPGIVKVGMSKRPLNERWNEANGAFGNVQNPWRIHIGKKVYDYKTKESMLHWILDKYRVEGAREQFNISIHEVAQLVKLMEGEWSYPTLKNRVEPNTPFEGHIYHGAHAIIHGLKLKYTKPNRKFFPPCRRQNCTCDESRYDMSISEWKTHLEEVHQERVDQHNASLPRRFPRPRVRAR